MGMIRDHIGLMIVHFAMHVVHFFPVDNAGLRTIWNSLRFAQKRDYQLT